MLRKRLFDCISDMKHIPSKTRSNIFFLIPLGLAVYFNIYALSVILGFVIIGSLAYHRANEKKRKIQDEIFAIFLMTYNLYLCFLGNFTQPYFIVAMLWVIVALWLYFNETKSNYWRNHSLWHIASAIITSLCILVYIL